MSPGLVCPVWISLLPQSGLVGRHASSALSSLRYCSAPTAILHPVIFARFCGLCRVSGGGHQSELKGLFPSPQTSGRLDFTGLDWLFAWDIAKSRLLDLDLQGLWL